MRARLLVMMLALSSLPTVVSSSDSVGTIPTWSQPRDTVRVMVRPVVTRADSIARAELEQRKDEASNQKWYWIASIAAGLIGVYWFARRVRAMEAQTRMEHYDDSFRTYFERFADEKQAVSIRAAAAIGLGGSAQHRDPLKRKIYPFQQQVVSLFVESLRTETDKALLNTIRDQLIAIGLPALQTLADSQYERYPSFVRTGDRDERELPAWLPLVSYDRYAARDIVSDDDRDYPYNYVASRDAITYILRNWALPGHLGKVTISLKQPVLWWSAVRTRLRPRWIDLTGFVGMALVNAELRDVRLDGTVLNGARFDRANLVNARLDGVQALFTRFDHANLCKAGFVGADLSRACFDCANLCYARFDNANLWEARLDGADFSMAQLDDAELRFTEKIEAAKWHGANWWAADITDEQRAWFEEHYPRAEQEKRRKDWGMDS